MQKEYRYRTDLWDRFTSAEKHGKFAVEIEYRSAMDRHRNRYKDLTELVLVLDRKMWAKYSDDKAMSSLYAELFNKADEYCFEHLKGEKLKYYMEITSKVI